MQLRTFRGNTLEECFQQVKTQLGREAVILQSRTYQPFLGRFGKPKHEVIAALDLNIGDTPAGTGSRDKGQPTAQRPADHPSSAPRPADRPPSSPRPDADRGIYGYSSGAPRTDQRPAQRAPESAQVNRAHDPGSRLRSVDPMNANNAPFPNAGSPASAYAPTRSSDHEAPQQRGYAAGAVMDPPAQQQGSNPYDDRMQRLEAQLSSLTSNMHQMTEAALARKSSRKAEPAKPEPAPSQVFFVSNDEPPMPYPAIAKRLIDAEVASPLVRRMLHEIPAGLSDQSAATEVRTRIAQRLLVHNRIEPQHGKSRILAFIGATGVGKTTTLTKIAARLSLLAQYKVGIVTMDTHRIAAAKQLETYGEILRVPVKVAYSQEEAFIAVQEFVAAKLDFILIDTAGKSPNDALPLAEVAATLREMATVTRFLCVPATLSAANVDHMVSRFHSILTPDALIVTKLDEAANNAYLGHLMNTQAKYGIPLAYVTNGQRVPDDLATADPHVMADKILPQATL